MTNGRELKRRVRERLAETGENYTRALREIRKQDEQERTEESGGAEAQTTFIGPTT